MPSARTLSRSLRIPPGSAAAPATALAAALAVVAATLAFPPAAAAAPRWTQIPPNAAYVLTVAVAPVSGIVYAGTPDAGVYRSLDRAGSWQRASAGLDASWIFDLAVDPTGGAVVYAATKQGVFKSTDAGASWTASALHGEARKIAVAPSQPQRARPCDPRRSLRHHPRPRRPVRALALNAASTRSRRGIPRRSGAEHSPRPAPDDLRIFCYATSLVDWIAHRPNRAGEP